MSAEPRSRPKGMDFARLAERYGSEEKCREYIEALRWPEGPMCPRCGKKATKIAGKGSWDSSCGYQFTVRVGTVLQDSKLPLWKWFVATLLMTEARKGISANEVRRLAGVSYKTAWFLTHRIREAMSQATDTTSLAGTVEVDETYIGGKRRYRHHGKTGWDRKGKVMVLGAVQRDGGVRLKVETRGANMGTLGQFIARNAEDAAIIYTDQAPAYRGAVGKAHHDTVNHSVDEWVRGDVHTNTIEGVWSLFKRSIVGSYHHMSVKHLDKYLDEVEWRYNNRRNQFLFRDTLRALLKSETMTYKTLKERSA